MKSRVVAFAFITIISPLHAGEKVSETSGDVLQLALPATAAVVTALHKDKEGAFQLMMSPATARKGYTWRRPFPWTFPLPVFCCPP